METGPVQLLIIDANPESAGWLASRLVPLGFAARSVASLREVTNCEGLAAVLVDSDGFAAGSRVLVDEVRRTGMVTPLAIVSSSADWRERIDALDAGADDVMVKPVRSEEIAARLRALVRRSSGNATDRIVSGDIRLDLNGRCAWRGPKCLNLTRSEFRLLSLLMREPDHSHDHGAIGRAVNQARGAASQNAVEVLVARLRRKVGHDRIRTVRGIGYRWTHAPAAEQPDAEPCEKGAMADTCQSELDSACCI